MADNGTVIIGAYRTSHVFMVVSGGLITTVNNIAHTEKGYLKPKYIENPKLEEGDKYGFSFVIDGRNIQYVPRILECGTNVKSANAPIYANMAYNQVNSNEVKWYRYIRK